MNFGLPSLHWPRLADLWPSSITMDRERWLTAIGVTAFALWYSRRVRAAKLRVPGGDDAESRRTRRIVADCPQLHSVYYPFLLDWPNLNTFLSYFWRPLYVWAPTPARHQLLVAEDGGTLALVWFEGPSTREDAPLVVLCPGNLGGWFAPYLRRVIYMCRARGLRVVAFVRRGADGNDLRCGLGMEGGWERMGNGWGGGGAGVGKRSADDCSPTQHAQTPAVHGHQRL